jgi:chromatin segregation and condensation protein Rec8/ScpA/Scc1 (kleisin family)
VDVLSTLLALLELAKRGLLRLDQSEAFASFIIRRETVRPDEPVPAATPTTDPAAPDAADDAARPAD